MAYDPNSPLPDSQEGILLGILEAINQLVSNSGVQDPLTRRGRIAVESIVALPANQSTNIAQWGGQTAAINAGAAGNGVPRVTPSNDTLAGLPAITSIPQAWYNTPISLLFDNIITS